MAARTPGPTARGETRPSSLRSTAARQGLLVAWRASREHATRALVYACGLCLRACMVGLLCCHSTSHPMDSCVLQRAQLAAVYRYVLWGTSFHQCMHVYCTTVLRFALNETPHATTHTCTEDCHPIRTRVQRVLRCKAGAGESYVPMALR